MDLDIVPHDSEAEVEMTVLWKGKAATERIVYIQGPKQFRKNAKTDEKGRVRSLQPPQENTLSAPVSKRLLLAEKATRITPLFATTVR